ncbi:UTP--GlnB (protein PII) uridylyltransferase, GlnD [Mariprofundus ferrinatatus]|uniref:Bifunctional uridylyltransferase/uridylyl-removing enzyme n=1 Tax=Mariprofundus ferrinatatus TaxID=1921087 RepID=A0A2K8L1Z1_9PROT|nr:[protein-PII] uridylyltransferase [Mariprofundus ferrinatatus]ATX81263.1 UTP--GlnB (protein PII) uridylyltransferase, GlnD [Mariprofundus ferrinatatus]
MLHSREALKQLHAAVADAFSAGASGTELTRIMCSGVDELLISLWQKKAPTAAACIDLVLVGGNGRGELAPKSDWDIWFLVAGDCSEAVEEEIQGFLLALWDMGAKIGHAVRSVKECLDHVNEDWNSATAASESRLLTGPGQLYGELQAGLEKFFKKRRKAFVEAKLEEVKARHNRTGGTAFWMEPDIKEGKGGLRDVQAVFWMAKVWYGCENIAELVEKGAISIVERDHLLSAQDFLWRCRTGLHLMMRRPSDRLGFEQQALLAEEMGYQPIPPRPAVDAFMKEYFRHVGRIARVSSLLFMHFREQLNPKLFSFTRSIDHGFTLEGKRLSIVDDNVFREEPLRLLRIFREAQKGKRRLSSRALRQIREDVLLIDDAMRDDPIAQRIFLKILRSKRNVQWALRQMHDTGVLGRFIPEFRDIVGLGQFNQYHAFTVDEHTIRAIGEARNFFHRDRYVRLPLAHEVCHKISRPELLYIALIFHDIAKGLPGDHSEVGAKMARRFCKRMQLDIDAVELVEWLVKEHLLMAVKSQRFDLSDPGVIRAFADRVGNQNRLNYLLLLTVADIAAVGPNVWNDWKGSLLSELYRLTENYFLSDETVTETAERLYQTRVRSMLNSVEGDEATIRETLELMSRQCVMHFPPRQLMDIVPLIAGSDGNAVKYWVDNDRSETLFYIVAHPRPGMFAALAAALTSGHASILAAQAYMLNDGRVLDVFHLQGPNGKPFNIHSDLERLEAKTRNLLAAETLPTLVFDKKFKVNLLMRNVRVRVRELPKASFRETAIEVSTADQPRLLARLADAIAREGYSLHGASVSTFGERAVDVFFIAGDNSGPLSDEQIGDLCAKLSEVAALPEDNA